MGLKNKWTSLGESGIDSPIVIEIGILSDGTLQTYISRSALQMCVLTRQCRRWKTSYDIIYPPPSSSKSLTFEAKFVLPIF